MSVAAIMLVKDEADVIQATVEHLLCHVDEVLVYDNASTDGTHDILRALGREHPVTTWLDPIPGYWQSRKMTELADVARGRGHAWVLPCDADEIWHVYEVGVRIGDYLDGQQRTVAIVQGNLFDHVTTDYAPDSRDPGDHPFDRIAWRRREPAPLAKIAARTLPGLVIEQGNHGAHYPGAVRVAGGLNIRHFPYRSLEQFIRKVVNGSRAYEATDLPWSMGQHWREYGQHFDRGGPAAIREIYETWFHVSDPTTDETLIFDPAPRRTLAADARTLPPCDG